MQTLRLTSWTKRHDEFPKVICFQGFAKFFDLDQVEFP